MARPTLLVYLCTCVVTIKDLLLLYLGPDFEVPFTLAVDACEVGTVGSVAG